MQIINIEKNVWERLISRIDEFSTRVDALCEKHSEKRIKKWLDNQQVCEILNISKRTLQTYRDTGVIGFSQVNHKMFYKQEDVLELLEKGRRR